jgi:hypothetical protein
MDAIGLLDFPGIKDEVESYFPGLLAQGLKGKVVEDFWLGTVVE